MCSSPGAAPRFEERFEVAAAGLVVLTALFAVGMARKQRRAALGVVIALAGIGISVIFNPAKTN